MTTLEIGRPALAVVDMSCETLAATLAVVGAWHIILNVNFLAKMENSDAVYFIRHFSDV